MRTSPEAFAPATFGTRSAIMLMKDVLPLPLGPMTASKRPPGRKPSTPCRILIVSSFLPHLPFFVMVKVRRFHSMETEEA